MPKKIEPEFYFIGNHVVLDYINTKIAVDGSPLDLFQEMRDVLDWLVKTNLFSAEEAENFSRRWKGSKEWKEILHAAIQLRGTLLSMLDKIRAGDHIAEEELHEVNQYLNRRMMNMALVQKDKGIALENRLIIEKPSDILSPVAEAAARFFSDYDLQLVKKCGNPACVLRFYDNSKNSTRRWCSQKTCGNRMKVAAFLKRKKMAAGK